MSQATTMPAGEAPTGNLIASDRVEGTAVYDRAGERLGTVHNFMVDKRSGQVAYAVMSFGGFLGMGESYHPLPWLHRPQQAGQFSDIVGEILFAFDTVTAQSAHCQLIRPRCSPQAEVDAARIQGSQGTKGFSNDQRRVIGQHHAPRAHTNPRSAAGNVPDQHRRGRARNPR